MKTFSNYLIATFLGVSIFSCSRPVAYFQPTSREQFKSTQPNVTSVAKETQPIALEIASTTKALPEQDLSAQQVDQAKLAMNRFEAYVRNDSKLTSNRKLTKRMARVSELLAKTNSQMDLSTKALSAQKTTLVQRVMLKRIDKKIKNHLSPERAMAKSLLTIGAIVGIIGLLLIILNVASPLGIIALVVGLVLVLVDLLR
ncbi:hypothetical protein [Spirosoma jeollabukense]